MERLADEPGSQIRSADTEVHHVGERLTCETSGVTRMDICNQLCHCRQRCLDLSGLRWLLCFARSAKQSVQRCALLRRINRRSANQVGKGFWQFAAARQGQQCLPGGLVDQMLGEIQSEARCLAPVALRALGIGIK